jgi:hypothetical protein
MKVLLTLQLFANASNFCSKAVYDSFLKLKPNQFPESSPEWNAVMIRYLLDMKKNGHKINEIEMTPKVI